VIVFVFAAAALSPTGMQLGGYEPFSMSRYAAALDDLVLWSIGLRAPWPWLAPICLATMAILVAVRRPEWIGSRGRLYALLILVVPVGLFAVRAGNSGFSRYYVTSAIGLLLLLSDWIARGLRGGTQTRVAAGALVATLIGVSLYRDYILILEVRGTPAAALEHVAAVAPRGARIAFAEPRLKGVVAVAANQSGYRARFAGGCSPADFLLGSQSRSVTTPALVYRCGVRMDAIDSFLTIPLIGDSWVLYRAEPLQTLGAADSGRAPAAVNAAFPAERA
jgi:hypothetical protein